MTPMILAPSPILWRPRIWTPRLWTPPSMRPSVRAGGAGGAGRGRSLAERGRRFLERLGLCHPHHLKYRNGHLVYNSGHLVYSCPNDEEPPDVPPDPHVGDLCGCWDTGDPLPATALVTLSGVEYAWEPTNDYCFNGCPGDSATNSLKYVSGTIGTVTVNLSGPGSCYWEGAGPGILYDQWTDDGGCFGDPVGTFSMQTKVELQVGGGSVTVHARGSPDGGLNWPVTYLYGAGQIVCPEATASCPNIYSEANGAHTHSCGLMGRDGVADVAF